VADRIGEQGRWEGVHRPDPEVSSCEGGTTVRAPGRGRGRHGEAKTYSDRRARNDRKQKKKRTVLKKQKVIPQQSTLIDSRAENREEVRASLA